MRTRDDILHDRTLTVNQKAEQIFALNDFERNQPPPAPPTPDAAERFWFAAIAKSLAAARDDLRSLESRGEKFDRELPGLQERLAALRLSTQPDAPTDSILRLMVEERRAHIMLEFLVNVSQRREDISRRIGNDFTRLNELLRKFGDTQFFLSGSRLDLNAQTAISAIETLLLR